MEIPVDLEDVQGDDLVDEEIDEMAQRGFAAFDGSLKLVRLPQQAGVGTLVLGQPPVAMLAEQRLLVLEVLAQMGQRRCHGRMPQPGFRVLFDRRGDQLVAAVEQLAVLHVDRRPAALVGFRPMKPKQLEDDLLTAAQYQSGTRP